MPLRDQLKIRDSSAANIGGVSAGPMPVKPCFAVAGAAARRRLGSSLPAPALPMHHVPENGGTLLACRPQPRASSTVETLPQRAMRAAILSAHGRLEVGGVICCAQRQESRANYHLAC